MYRQFAIVVVSYRHIKLPSGYLSLVSGYWWHVYVHTLREIRGYTSDMICYKMFKGVVGCLFFDTESGSSIGL